MTRFNTAADRDHEMARRRVYSLRARSGHDPYNYRGKQIEDYLNGLPTLSEIVCNTLRDRPNSMARALGKNQVLVDLIAARDSRGP